MRRLVGVTGDVNPIDYGGGVVFSDDYGIHWWFWEPSDDEEFGRGKYTIWRVTVPEDVFAAQKWANPFEIAKTHGMHPFTLQALGQSRDPMERVAALGMIAGHYGADNLDSYPLVENRSWLHERFGAMLRRNRRRR